MSQAQVEASDKLFWVVLRRIWEGWKEALVLVQRDTSFVSQTTRSAEGRSNRNRNNKSKNNGNRKNNRKSSNKDHKELWPSCM